MSELHIRINRRTFERVIFTVIILVLAGMLFFQQPGTAVDEQQVSDLQAQVDNLSATNDDLRDQVDSLQSQVSTLEAQNENLTESEGSDEQQVQSEPDTEPEPELSGEIGVTWDVTTDSGDVERVTIVLENGLETTQELGYRLVWQNFNEDNLYRGGDAVISSGEQETIIIQDMPSAGDNADILELTIRDSNNGLIEQLEQEV